MGLREPVGTLRATGVSQKTLNYDKRKEEKFNFMRTNQ